MQRILISLFAIAVVLGALGALAPEAIAQPANGRPIPLHVEPSAGPPSAAARAGVTVRPPPILDTTASPHGDLVESNGKGMALLFWAFAAASIGGALFVVTRRNLIAAVMGMVGSFLGIAAVYMMLYAHFLAVVQMLVYAGAIMVLFVFVIMILNRPEDEPVAPTGHVGQAVGGVAILYLIARLVMVLVHVHPPGDPAKIDAAVKAQKQILSDLDRAQAAVDAAGAANQPADPGALQLLAQGPGRLEAAQLRYDTVTARVAPPPVQLPSGEVAEWGTVKAVGTDLFSGGLFPFEAISILLLIAVVGAIAIAKPLKDDDGEDDDNDSGLGEDLAAAAVGPPMTEGGHA